MIVTSSMSPLSCKQCDQIWRNFATEAEWQTSLAKFNIWLVWTNFGSIFIVENGLILKNNLGIWSHCLKSTLQPCISQSLEAFTLHSSLSFRYNEVLWSLKPELSLDAYFQTLSHLTLAQNLFVTNLSWAIM